MPETQKLQCLQVWGDNRAVDNDVVMPGLDAWVHSRPAGAAEAGGDVHYVSSCAAGNVVRLLVADVSGHGAAVAEIAGRLRGLMRRHINSPDQRKLLAKINREFLGLSRPDQFATAVMITCWTPTGELTISCAGHPSPLRYRAGSEQWEPLFELGKHTNLPLGIEPDADFGQTTVKLGREDLLMVYSDGLIESRDAGGQMLGTDGLLSLLAGLRDEPADAVVPALAERVSARRDRGGAEDDTTIMLMRPNDLRPSDSPFSGLMAAMRMVRGMAKSMVSPGADRV